jgi:uncharacterized protein (DUF2252 family)
MRNGGDDAMAKTVKTPRFVRASTKGQVRSTLRLAGQSTASAMFAEGKTKRRTTPRKAHHAIGRLPATRDPVRLIVASNEDRVSALVPVRHTRMLESPFTFYRGTAGVQAYDLAHAPSSGIEVQCCGDAHLMNFGGFATPERNFVFDLNDFDEAFPAPFEWDVKRLSASFVLAARWRGFSESVAQDIAEATARAYRERIAASSREATLDTWYAAVTWEGIRNQVAGDAKILKGIDSIVAKAHSRTGENVFYRLTKTGDGEPRLLDQPPLLYHPPDIDLTSVAKPFLDGYANTLREDVRSLFSRLRFVDAALKVVGVGSVGTRCLVLLMLGEQNEPVFLQVKEARGSVLADTSRTPRWANNGERVVAGQRAMQAASDIFLGWSKGVNNRDFYVRQLRDMKMSVDLAGIRQAGLNFYGVLCGQTLARAHAKAGGATRIAGYLGRSEAFDTAIGRYALAYADQAERDYEAFRRAAAAGTIRTEATAEPEQLAIA